MKSYTKDNFPPNAHRNARQRKIYKERKKEIIERGNGCEECGEKGNLQNPLLIHHVNEREAYKAENYQLYAELKGLEIQILCKRCHFHIHQGRRLCPFCKSSYGSYLYPTCWKCSQKLNDNDRRELLCIYNSLDFSDRRDKRMFNFLDNHPELFS